MKSVRIGERLGTFVVFYQVYALKTKESLFALIYFKNKGFEEIFGRKFITFGLKFNKEITFDFFLKFF